MSNTFFPSRELLHKIKNGMSACEFEWVQLLLYAHVKSKEKLALEKRWIKKWAMLKNLWVLPLS